MQISESVKENAERTESLKGNTKLNWQENQQASTSKNKISWTKKANEFRFFLTEQGTIEMGAKNQGYPQKLRQFWVIQHSLNIKPKIVMKMAVAKRWLQKIVTQNVKKKKTWKNTK